MWKTKQVLAQHALISLQDGITINAKMINVCIQKLYVFATDSSAITDYRIKFFFLIDGLSKVNLVLFLPLLEQ